jgi:hypothetical protein
MKIGQVALLSLIAVSAVGCFHNTPGDALLYTSLKGETNVTPNTVGSKRGEACAGIYLGLVGVGDMSQEAAAQAGGITKIAYVDVDYMNVLGIYQKRCTIVKGE